MCTKERFRSFHRVVAVHSFQFWPDLGRDLQEVQRVLLPGGVLVLILRRLCLSKTSIGVNSIARAYPDDLEELTDALQGAGFPLVDVVGDKEVIASLP
jgi:ubiquinone/menaquinone biosynthesis C-methylase UbiE